MTKCEVIADYVSDWLP